MMASFVENGVYASIGVHPVDEQGALFREPFFSDLVAYPRVVAVGECGLDYSSLGEVVDISVEKTRQRKLFEAQVDFAVAHDLPLMLHVRDSDKALADAHRDILAILSEKKKHEFYQKMVGKELTILFENEDHNGMMKGFSSNYVRIKHSFDHELINKFVKVKIKEVDENICTTENISINESINIQAG